MHDFCGDWIDEGCRYSVVCKWSPCVGASALHRGERIVDGNHGAARSGDVSLREITRFLEIRGNHHARGRWSDVAKNLDRVHEERLVPAVIQARDADRPRQVSPRIMQPVGCFLSPGRVRFKCVGVQNVVAHIPPRGAVVVVGAAAQTDGDYAAARSAVFGIVQVGLNWVWLL